MNIEVPLNYKLLIYTIMNKDVTFLFYSDKLFTGNTLS